MTTIPLLPIEFRKPHACGECSLCCRLMGVKELQKKPITWCPHVTKGCGCGIYATRPETCRSFECVWLSTPSAPDALRPDKIGGVLVATYDNSGSAVLHEDPDYPGLALTALKPLLDAFVQDGAHYYIVISGRERKRTFYSVNPALMSEALALLDAINDEFKEG